MYNVYKWYLIILGWFFGKSLLEIIIESADRNSDYVLLGYSKNGVSRKLRIPISVYVNLRVCIGDSVLVYHDPAMEELPVFTPRRSELIYIHTNNTQLFKNFHCIVVTDPFLSIIEPTGFMLERKLVINYQYELSLEYDHNLKYGTNYGNYVIIPDARKATWDCYPI